MNQNHPFFSTNTNLYDECLRSSAPTTVNGQNVIVAQEQQRRIYDTLNTSVVGSPVVNSVFFGTGALQAQKQYYPGGVTFSFSQIQQQPTIPGLCKCGPVSFPAQQEPYNFQPAAQYFQPITPNTFFPSFEQKLLLKPLQQFSFESNKAQQSNVSPFQLKFHHDIGTSCSEFPQTSGRKFFCPKNVVPPCGHVVDVLEEENSKPNEIKKEVTFDEGGSNKCTCKGNKSKSKTKRKKSKSDVSTDEESSQSKKIKNGKKSGKNSSNQSVKASSSESKMHVDDSEKNGKGNEKSSCESVQHKPNDVSTDEESGKTEKVKKKKRKKAKKKSCDSDGSSSSSNSEPRGRKNKKNKTKKRAKQSESNTSNSSCTSDRTKSESDLSEDCLCYKI